MGKKKFAIIAFDLEYEALVVHIAALSVDLGNKIYSSKKAQIAYLKVDKLLPKFLASILTLQTFFYQNWLQSSQSTQKLTIMPSS